MYADNCSTQEIFDIESVNYGYDYGKFYGSIYLKDGTKILFDDTIQ